jgi:hypothetical protein
MQGINLTNCWKHSVSDGTCRNACDNPYSGASNAPTTHNVVESISREDLVRQLADGNPQRLYVRIPIISGF